MLELETYLFTNVGQIAVPPQLAAKLNAIPKRKDGWWDQRYSAGRRAADWFDLVNVQACEAWAGGGNACDIQLPDFN